MSRPSPKASEILTRMEEAVAVVRRLGAEWNALEEKLRSEMGVEERDILMTEWTRIHNLIVDTLRLHQDLHTELDKELGIEVDVAPLAQNAGKPKTEKPK